MAYTNAATIVDEDFQDTEDLDGLFSGFDAETGALRPDDLAVRRRRRDARRAADGGARRGRRERRRRATGSRTRRRGRRATAPAAHRSAGRAAAGRDAAAPALRVPDPQAALRPLHARRWCEEVCGIAPEHVRAGRRRADQQQRARAHDARSATPSAGPSTASAPRTSAPPRSCSCCSATSAVPAAGIMALRGHASIQGSTDIPTLFNILPGYIPMPHAEQHQSTWTSWRRGRRGQGRASGATCGPTPSAC